jgi:hypothetical protein
LTSDLHPRVKLQTPTVGGSPSYVQLSFENCGLVPGNEVELALHSTVAKIIGSPSVRVRYTAGRWQALCSFEVPERLAATAQLPFELCLTARLGDTTVGCWSGTFHVPRYVGDDIKTALQGGETLEVLAKGGVFELDALGKGYAHTRIVLENGMAVDSGLANGREAAAKSVAMHKWSVYLAQEATDFAPVWKEAAPQPHPWPADRLGIIGDASAPSRYVRVFAKDRLTFGRLELGLPAGETIPDVWLYAMQGGAPTSAGPTARLSGEHLVIEQQAGAFVLRCPGRWGVLVKDAQGSHILKGDTSRPLAMGDTIELTATARGIAEFVVLHSGDQGLELARCDEAGAGYEVILLVPPETAPRRRSGLPTPSDWPGIWHERGGFWWVLAPGAEPQPLDPGAVGGCRVNGPVLQGRVVAQPYPEFTG